MQNSAGTQYHVYLQCSNGEIGTLVVSDFMGFDDAKAADFVQMLRDFAWPSGVGSLSLSASKTYQSTDTYTCNTASTPPTFN
jgi:hypothetical protein